MDSDSEYSYRQNILIQTRSINAFHLYLGFPSGKRYPPSAAGIPRVLSQRKEYRWLGNHTGIILA